MSRYLAIALLTAASALPVHAQVLLRWPATTEPAPQQASAPAPASTQVSTILPVVNRETGDFEAFLLVEPVAATAVPGLTVLPSRIGYRPVANGSRRLFNLWGGDQGIRLSGGLRLDNGGGFALLCDGPAGVVQSLGGLTRHCSLAALDDADDPVLRYTPSIGAGVSLDSGAFRLDLGANAQRLNLGDLGVGERRVYPGYSLASASADRWFKRPQLTQAFAGLRLDQVDIGGNAVFQLGEQGWLSIGGSVARARLIASTNALFRSGSWIRRDLGVVGGWGAFSGYVGGHSLSGLDGSRFSGLDLGVSWRTPWNGLLSVGAENVVSGGDNRTGLSQTGLPDEPQGSTPYVRYQQDL